MLLPSAPKHTLLWPHGTEGRKHIEEKCLRAFRPDQFWFQRWQTKISHRKFITYPTPLLFQWNLTKKECGHFFMLFSQSITDCYRWKTIGRGPIAFARDEKLRPQRLSRLPTAASWAGSKSPSRTQLWHSALISFPSWHFWCSVQAWATAASQKLLGESRSLKSSSEFLPLHHACSYLTMD